jgi:hypothetical protein
MFLRTEKIFAVYEKPEAPTERVVLLREGFLFWAFAFSGLWLIVKRMWWVLAGYLAAVIALAAVAAELQLTEAATIALQFWLQVMVGYYANEVQGWVLTRRGYRLAGIIAAESEMYAHRRYYEYVT